MIFGNLQAPPHASAVHFLIPSCLFAPNKPKVPPEHMAEMGSQSPRLALGRQRLCALQPCFLIVPYLPDNNELIMSTVHLIPLGALR